MIRLNVSFYTYYTIIYFFYIAIFKKVVIVFNNYMFNNIE